MRKLCWAAPLAFSSNIAHSGIFRVHLISYVFMRSPSMEWAWVDASVTVRSPSRSRASCFELLLPLLRPTQRKYWKRPLKRGRYDSATSPNTKTREYKTIQFQPAMRQTLQRKPFNMFGSVCHEKFDYTDRWTASKTFAGTDRRRRWKCNSSELKVGPAPTHAPVPVPD